MKIGEFANCNQVTAKMLRHYDEIGLLKPESIDQTTGYRLYSESQSHRLNWILILKNLDFSLLEIKSLLCGPVSSTHLVMNLIQKRICIAGGLNEQIQKKLQIDRLICFLETEGFKMDQKVNLLELTEANIHDLKKNIPNTEMFLEAAQAVVAKCTEGETIGILRFDLCAFKEINDTNGYEIGDKVILACYQSIEKSLAPYEDCSALGRAGGDEFIAIVKGNPETVESIANEVIAQMKSVDFKKMGCYKQVAVRIGGIAVRIGGIVANKSADFKLRQSIDQTYESLAMARKKGENSIVIEKLN